MTSESENRVEELNKRLAERDNIIKRLTNELGNKTEGTNTADLMLIIKEYQGQIANFEIVQQKHLQNIYDLEKKIEKLVSRNSEAEIAKLKQENVALEKANQVSKDDLSELKLKLNHGLKRELQLIALKQNLEEAATEKSDLNTQIDWFKNEKNDLQKQLETQIQQLEAQSSTQKQREQNQNKLQQNVDTLEAEKQSLEAEKQQLIEEKQRLIAEIESYKTEKESIEKERRTLEEESQKLESKLKIATAEIEELNELTHFQAEKYEQLKSTHEAEAKSSEKIPIKLGSSKDIKYFTLKKGKFVESPRKPDGIILALNIVQEKWIITIDPKVPFVEKNIALRQARSLPNTGFRTSKGLLLGKGFNLVIVGE